MITKIILVVLIIILGAVVVIPYSLSVAGIETESILPGQGRIRSSGVFIRSEDGGKTWRGAVFSDWNSDTPPPVLDVSFASYPQRFGWLGTRGAGLWKSEDEGKTWRRVGDQNGVLKKESSVFAVDLSQGGDTFYLAVYQDRRTSVLQTKDGGKSFREIYRSPSASDSIKTLAVDPTNPSRVFIGGRDGSLFESSDGGESWQSLHWFRGEIEGLWMNPFFGKEMYALVSGRLSKSTDGGVSWTDLEEAIDEAAGKDRLLAISRPSSANFLQGGSIFSGTAASGQTQAFAARRGRFTDIAILSRGGLMRSENGGISWSRLPLVLSQGESPNAFALATGRATFYMAAGSRLHKSEDGGIHWRVSSLPPGSRISALFLHPSQPELMFAAAK
jgi:photosystem II stability/assembly factor-like uncharacterized protein